MLATLPTPGAPLSRGHPWLQQSTWEGLRCHLAVGGRLLAAAYFISSSNLLVEKGPSVSPKPAVHLPKPARPRREGSPSTPWGPGDCRCCALYQSKVL